KKLLIRQPRVIKSDHILLNHSHLLSPRFGSIGDPWVHHSHKYIAQNRGYNKQYPIEEGHTYNDRVVVSADCLYQQSANTGNGVDLLHDNRAGESPGDHPRDTVGNGDGGILENVLGKDLPLAEPFRPGKLYIIRVHLV